MIFQFQNTRHNTLNVVIIATSLHIAITAGRWHCFTFRFVRSVNGSRVGNEDQNLNNSLYVLYGVGQRTVDELRFLVHDFGPALPALSVQRFNPAVDTNANVIMETVGRKLAFLGYSYKFYSSLLGSWWVYLVIIATNYSSYIFLQTLFLK